MVPWRHFDHNQRSVPFVVQAGVEPIEELKTAQFDSRGEWKALYHHGNGTTEDPDLLAFGWVDRDRRYFISNTSNLRPGQTIDRRRLRQVDKSPNAPPEHVDLRIEQPNCSAIYYDNCGMIDRHNRLRQDDLQIERKYVTQLWYQQVNLSLFAMCVMDAYLLYKACTLSNAPPAEFIWKLAAELIDNDKAPRRRPVDTTTPATLKRPSTDDPSPPSAAGIHITPTKVWKQYPRKRDGKIVTYNGKPVMRDRRDQQRCCVCNLQTSYTCSHCTDKNGKPIYCHPPRNGHTCWPTHFNHAHAELEDELDAAIEATTLFSV